MPIPVSRARGRAEPTRRALPKPAWRPLRRGVLRGLAEAAVSESPRDALSRFGVDPALAGGGAGLCADLPEPGRFVSRAAGGDPRVAEPRRRTTPRPRFRGPGVGAAGALSATAKRAPQSATLDRSHAARSCRFGCASSTQRSIGSSAKARPNQRLRSGSWLDTSGVIGLGTRGAEALGRSFAAPPPLGRTLFRISSARAAPRTPHRSRVDSD